ncbi:MAG: glycosyltransferase family protein [Arenicellales bacterium WSBS_2016_MAG_OTU3]
MVQLTNVSTPVLIYVQHLLGTGHLRRMLLVANACAKLGLSVTVVSGGFPVKNLSIDNINFIQLDPIRAADAGFSKLVVANGVAATEKTWAHRHAALRTCIEEVKPSLLLIESYPFARRKMRQEIVSLIEYTKHTNPDTKILCSVRDVLQFKNRLERRMETVDVFNTYFDALLVHADPEIVKLEGSFPEIGQLIHPIHYTGFVANVISEQALNTPPSHEVLVSAGGGTAAGKLFETAIAVAATSAFRESKWRLLISHEFDNREFEQLRSKATDNIIVERVRIDYANLLASAAVSVSQAGYNTVMELLQTSTPSVLIPFEKDGETEQFTRARLLSENWHVVILREADLARNTLVDALQKALSNRPANARVTDMHGAETSAKLIAGYACYAN